LLRRHVADAMIEERRGQVRDAKLVFRIRGGSGPQQQPHRHRGLLMVQDRDDLQSVRQRLDFVGRKLDIPGRQGLRRALCGPVARLRRCGRGRAKDTKEENKGHKGFHCAPVFPDGISVRTSRFSGRKYVRATRCTSATVMFWKMSNSPSAVLMSLWMTTACESCPAFCWFDWRLRM